MDFKGQYDTETKHQDERNLQEAIEAGRKWAALALALSRETNQRVRRQMAAELDGILQGSGYLQRLSQSYGLLSGSSIDCSHPNFEHFVTFLANRYHDKRDLEDLSCRGLMRANADFDRSDVFVLSSIA